MTDRLAEVITEALARAGWDSRPANEVRSRVAAEAARKHFLEHPEDFGLEYVRGSGFQLYRLRAEESV